MRKWMFIIIAGLLVWTLPAGAQDSGWTAWLYNNANGGMTLVNESGILDAYTLPLPAGFDRYPQRAAVGHSSSPVAYVAYNSTTFQGVLVVSQREAILASFNLPLTIASSTELVADESLFNEDDSRVALGYALDGTGWAMVVLDIPTNTIEYSLRFDSPLVAALGIPAGYGLTPVVRHFVGNQVVFNLVQTGTEGASYYDGYTWTLDTGTISANAAYPSLDSDTFLPTGETILSLADERLPSHPDAFIFFQANTLQVIEPASGARYPFHNNPDRTLFSPHFIQNGELILVDSVDAESRFSWNVIGRDGTLLGTLPTAITINDVAGTPDGFIYTTGTFSPGLTTLVYVNTVDGLDGGVPVWSGGTEETWLIAWAGGSNTPSSLYVPWARLADPVLSPGQTPLSVTPAVVSPNQVNPATPVITRFLAVGGIALVNTTEGDQLNIRLGAGRDFAIVAKLNAGERVTLLEGPRAAEGFTWWKVRTGSGIEGWAVESVDDNGTRLQTLVPG